MIDLWQARSQDLEKGGGGLFWKSEKSANDLDPNFHCPWISVTWFLWKSRWHFSEISEFQTLYLPKVRGSPKKKGLHRFWDWFFGQTRKFKRFFRPISGDLQKKGLHRFLDWFFGQNRKIERLRGGCFPMGGLFSIFHQKSASKAPKTCDFAYFTSQWGGYSPRPPPLATLLTSDNFRLQE